MSKKDSKETKDLNDCYQELFKKVVDLQARYNNQMIAGTMMAQALRLYKSNLSEEGFKAMVETIADSGDTIEPFDPPTIN